MKTKLSFDSFYSLSVIAYLLFMVFVFLFVEPGSQKLLIIIATLIHLTLAIAKWIYDKPE